MLKQLNGLSHGLILHGHSHIRVRRSVTTEMGRVDVFGATSASLLSSHPHRHAGFNVYEMDDAGKMLTSEAHVLGDDGNFLRVEIPVDSSKLRHQH